MPTRIAPLSVLFLALPASPLAVALEEPAYEVIEQDGDFELREYAAYLVAETRVEASFSEAGNVAFRRLFRYIGVGEGIDDLVPFSAREYVDALLDPAG